MPGFLDVSPMNSLAIQSLFPPFKSNIYAYSNLQYSIFTIHTYARTYVAIVRA